jgi:hypothetical protein
MCPLSNVLSVKVMCNTNNLESLTRQLRRDTWYR